MKDLILLFTSFILCAICLAPLSASAHHSYAVYDIDNKTSLTGTVKSYRFSEPHPVIMLEVSDESGAIQTWYVEGPSMRHWRENNLPADIATAGELVTVSGWASRDGNDKMLLSAVQRETGASIMILDQVRQPQALAAAAQYRRESLQSGN